jgi:hypothetical protein
MRNLFTVIIASILFFAGSKNSFGQDPIAIDQIIEKRQEVLKPQVLELNRHFATQRHRALQLAAGRGWIVREELPEGGVLELQRIDETGMPVYYITHFNTRAAATISTNHLWPGGRSTINLSGSLPALAGRLGLWDGGSVLDTHQEFTGRVIHGESTVTANDHATHVAGTMMAAGVNSLARGMAFGAPNIISWDFANHSDEMAGAAGSLLVSNHSYGAISGWRFNTTRAGTAANPNWEWWGDINVSTTEDFKFGYYDEMAMLWDMLAFANPFYLIVKSAGNNRNDNGPATGQPFWRRNATGQWELQGARPGGISSNDGFDIIPTYGNAKNILTVGAVNPIDGGFRSPQDLVMSSFSSYGPTDDGRIKPDISANGVNLYSASSAGNTSYRFTSGTSMSAPNVSGSLLLLQELFHVRNQRFMLSSTLRGLVCHTADDGGNPGPDYSFGWGLMNTERAALAIQNRGQTSLIEEVSLQTGTAVTRTVVASGKEPLVITIAWTDPEATPLTINPQVLNNRTPRLVNDLDVRITDGTTTFMPWVLNPNFPSSVATRGDNVVDNIEQIVINPPVPGRTYTIAISHKGQTLVRGPQIVSLIVTGIGGQAVCTSGATSSEGARIDRVQIGAINSITNTGCSTFRDLTSLSARVNLGAVYPFTITTGTCTVENPRIIKLFADWNASGSFEANELIATSPVITTSGTFTGNLQVPQHAVPLSSVLLRVVLTETNNPQEVQACGPYLAGETQDFLLRIENALLDVAPMAITGIINNLCASQNQGLEITFDNRGLQSVTRFETEVRIMENGNLLKSFTETIPISISPQSVSSFRLRETFTTLPNREYSIFVTTRLVNDVNSANDTISLRFHTAPISTGLLAEAIRCGQQPDVLLRATTDGVVFWYDREANPSLLNAGNNRQISTMPASGTIFAGLNNFSGRLGPATKNTTPWTGGTYARATAHPLITTHVPLIIESARLYVGNSGFVTFHVEDAVTGEIVSMTTLFVSATRTVPTAEVPAPDDPNDMGRVYPLNLSIPRPGNYRITISYGDGTTLFRNNARTTTDPYPYSIPHVITITGTTAGETPTGFYYWFYEMNITALGCPAQLVEVIPQNRPLPVVDLAGTKTFVEGQLVLNAGNPGSAFRWNTGATTQTIAPKAPGYFFVVVTNEWGCQGSDGINVTVTSVQDPHEINARVFPNPATSHVRMVSPMPATMELFNASGQLLRRSAQAETDAIFDVSDLTPGIYFIRITEITTGHSARFKLIVN